MASKFRLAGGIPERPVRPIWDAIDSRQFKNALKHSATLLSKYPNSPYAFVSFEGVDIGKNGQNDEALSICLNAKKILFTNDSSIFIDGLTLSTLQIVFQRLNHFDMATSCYEYACGKYPNNLVPSIRHSVGRPAPATSLDLRDTTFNPKEKIWTRFPPQGLKHTPRQSCAFKWKDYCPLVFRTLRKLFKMDPADYLISICGDDALRLLPSPGKSGSFLALLLSISVWVRFFPWES